VRKNRAVTILAQYSTPGYVVDFPQDPAKQATMNALWNGNVVRWVMAAQIGNVYDLTNYGPRPAFYNPLVTDTPVGATVAPITWGAFPGRFSALFPDQGADWNHWSDYGGMPDITIDLCSGQSIPPRQYGPTGPRGWQDEYCEWSVARDVNGNIVSVMFTCENPEYWMTLWACDPNAVLQLYQSLVSPRASLIDLALKDAQGRPVTDPTTGRWAYNPLNQWNNGPHAMADKGGAVHLTSSPNTLGAEFDLAAAATMPRQNPPGTILTTAADLVCCGRYGQIGRNSDPKIGQNVNGFVNRLGLQGALLTLTDPPGLYIQTPDFSTYKAPDGSDPASYWTVVRGRTKGANDPIDRILHATYAVPPGKGFTVSDITIAGERIEFGGQIAATIQMALLGTVFASGGANQPPVSCTGGDLPDNQVMPAAQALQDRAVFEAYRTVEAAQHERLLSIPILALPIAQGATLRNIVLPLNLEQPPASATVTTTNPKVTVAVTDIAVVESMASLIVTIAAAGAPTGDCGITVSVPGHPVSPTPVLGLLTVVPSSQRPVVMAGRAINPRFGGRL
jgi:hypothetical protein